MAGRSFTELEKQYAGRYDDFCSLAKRVTETYSRSLREYSQSQIAKDFDLSTSAVRKMMDFAIVNALVTKQTAEYVMQKAIENQQRNHPEAGASTVSHHNELMGKRYEVIAYSLPRDEVKKIVEDAVEANGRSLADTAKRFQLESMKELQYVLERGIIEDIATDEEVITLMDRSVKKDPSRKEYFENLIFNRQAFRQEEYERQIQEQVDSSGW